MKTTSETSRGAPPARGRPRSFDTDRVLDEVLELFWRKGYRSTTTRDLESELGLRQSSLYNAFGSKHDLLLAALDRYERRLDRELLSSLEGSDPGLAAIARFFDDLEHWVTRDGRRGCMIINLMAEDGGETDEITERTRGYRARVRRALHRALQRAARRGEMTDHGLASRADVLYGMVLGLNVAARGGAGSREVRRLIGAAHHTISEWRIPAG